MAAEGGGGVLGRMLGPYGVLRGNRQGGPALRRPGGLVIRGLAVCIGAGHPRLRDHGLRHGGRGTDVRQTPAIRCPAALLGNTGRQGQPERC